MKTSRLALSALVCVAVVGLSGCGMRIPADPHGTIERVEGGTLRVGATELSPWVELDAGGEPSGLEPELVTEFAETLDAEVQWATGSEALLLDALERGEIDMVIGGFRDDTPWTEGGAVTRPYTERRTEHGVEKHVMIVRMGENALLSELETFLHEEGAS